MLTDVNAQTVSTVRKTLRKVSGNLLFSLELYLVGVVILQILLDLIVGKSHLTYMHFQ